VTKVFEWRESGLPISRAFDNALEFDGGDALLVEFCGE